MWFFTLVAACFLLAPSAHAFGAGAPSCDVLSVRQMARQSDVQVGLGMAGPGGFVISSKASTNGTYIISVRPANMTIVPNYCGILLVAYMNMQGAMGPSAMGRFPTTGYNGTLFAPVASCDTGSALTQKSGDEKEWTSASFVYRPSMTGIHTFDLAVVFDMPVSGMKRRHGAPAPGAGAAPGAEEEPHMTMSWYKVKAFNLTVTSLTWSTNPSTSTNPTTGTTNPTSGGGTEATPSKSPMARMSPIPGMSPASGSVGLTGNNEKSNAADAVRGIFELSVLGTVLAMLL